MLKQAFSRSEEKKFLAKLIFALLFVYICLFEFILEANRILPKPTLLLESFVSIWKDYDLLFALIITISVIYLSMIAGYFFIYAVKNLLCRIYYSYPLMLSGSKVFKYFPAFFYAVLFEYWFRGSYAAEFFFAFLAIVSLYLSSFYSVIKEVAPEYTLFARSLKLPESEIFSKVVWNAQRPGLLKSVKRFNFYLWVLVLLFEFIANVEGLGKVYHQMLIYRDLSGLISVALIMAVTLYVTNKLIEFIIEKSVTWKD